MKSPTCKCASLAEVVVGKTSKLPSRHTEFVDDKSHPASPPPYASISLFKCTVCGTHWQADGMQGRVSTGISWPLVCIKIADPASWQTFNDVPARLRHFPELNNGVVLDRDCETPKCGGLPVRGLPYCAKCTSALRAKGVAVAGFNE